MTEDEHSEIAGAWLSPSEALTRFVPRAAAQSDELHAVAPIRFGFRVGEIGLLVPPGMLSELLEGIKIYPLPITPSWFCGLINLRGSLVPVFDLKILFDMQAQNGKNSHLMVLNTGEEAVGVLIDGIPITIDANQNLEQLPMLPSVLREHSRAVYMFNQDLWVEFDFAGLFRAAAERTYA